MFIAMAIFNFVPTPSALDTSTGSRPFLSSAKSPANQPHPPLTPRPFCPRRKTPPQQPHPADHAARERARSQAPDALLGLVRKRNIHTCFGVVHNYRRAASTAPPPDVGLFL